jgi:iron(III) transport system ATP-binding protein
VNVLSAVAEGAGRFRIGNLVLDCASCDAEIAPGTAVKLYLRPEDVVVDGAATLPNRARSQVTKIEFLGAFCLVTVTVSGVEGQPLLINISRHDTDEMALSEGSTLDVALPPECMRVLA